LANRTLFLLLLLLGPLLVSDAYACPLRGGPREISIEQCHGFCLGEGPGLEKLCRSRCESLRLRVKASHNACQQRGCVDYGTGSGG
jgi:hypothetical protein